MTKKKNVQLQQIAGGFMNLRLFRSGQQQCATLHPESWFSYDDNSDRRVSRHRRRRCCVEQIALLSLTLSI